VSEIEMKACPWCGRAPEVSRSPTGIGNLIMCNAHFDECPATPAVDEGTMESAARAWNTRAPQWQPIESAPKDGTEIDLWHPKLGRITGSHWDAYMERWTILCDPEGPTHFMLPPAPPEVG